MDEVIIEPPGTLHGQLQRGRGIGAQRALHEATAGELVYDCITRDPRPRGSFSERSLYYARLVNDLRLPFGPLVEHLFEPDNADDHDEHAVELAISVLADLTQMGYTTAAKALRDYCVEGRHWTSAFSALQLIDDPALMQGLDELLLDRVEDDVELAGLLFRESSFVKEWADKHSRIAAALEEQSAAREEARITVQSKIREYTDARLLAMVYSDTILADTAIGVLGRRGDMRLLTLVERLPQERRWPSPGAIAEAVTSLGPMALPHSRSWVTGPDPLRNIGYRVLMRHGAAEDAPLLLERLFAMAEIHRWSDVVDLATALARLRVKEVCPPLHTAWHETSNSLDRVFLLRALHALDPRGAAPYLVEALWDCQRGVRSLGVKAAPMDTATRARMEFLRDDEAESLDVKEAASERLADLDHIV